jgi:hypothetical protein
LMIVSLQVLNTGISFMSCFTDGGGII